MSRRLPGEPSNDNAGWSTGNDQVRTERYDNSQIISDSIANDLHRTVVISAETVITPYDILKNQAITIRDGLIISIQPVEAALAANGPAGNAIRNYDIIVPGFIDIQVNGVGSVDVASASSGQMEEIGRALLAQGTTTWCPTVITAPLPELESQLQKINDIALHPIEDLPHIAGAHLEGPFITVAGAHPTEYMIAKVDLDVLRRLAPYLTIITLAPEIDGAMDAIRYLSSEGVVVSLGHSNCTAEQAHDAIDRGAGLVTHLGNAMSAMHHRKPGLVGAGLEDGRVRVSLIADLIHSHPYFLELAFKSKGPDHIAIITDSVAAGLGVIGAAPINSSPSDDDDNAYIPRTADGQLAGSTVTMPQSIANLHNRCSIELTSCIEAATASPARLLGLSDRGHIAIGNQADLVALQKDTFSVQATYINGTLAYSPPTGLYNAQTAE